MALNIKDPRADDLARQLADATGESITLAVSVALQERLERVRSRSSSKGLVAQLTDIALRTAALPETDDRSVDRLLGYDEHGLPT